MQIAIPKETLPGEHRVALVPHLVQSLAQLGATILMEQGAACSANYLDEQYQSVRFYPDKASLYQDADIILKVGIPSLEEITCFKKNAILIGLLNPTQHLEQVAALRTCAITSFALELLPRISRAQAMDALSSQATVAGYKAVLIAANLSQRFFPMLTTAAGTIRPTNVLVIGAGVAGLQAIATARRLGANVQAYDVRTAAKEQIESLGAKMIALAVQAEGSGGYARELNHDEKQQQQALLATAVAKAEVIISSALIPGKSAPKIIDQNMVESMSNGAVIVDVAACNGGNCLLTQADQTICHQGVWIDGPTNLPSLLARDASNMYAKNVISFVQLLIDSGKIAINWQDPILAESVLTHEGEIKNPSIQKLVETNL